MYDMRHMRYVTNVTPYAAVNEPASLKNIFEIYALFVVKFYRNRFTWLRQTLFIQAPKFHLAPLDDAPLM